MTVGSLFSGIGGLDLGLERAGFEIRWMCEQNPFCRRVLAKHWPHVPCYEDVCALKGSDVERVDALVGGFPCQDVSNAGRQRGIDGDRSGLWSEFARLIREIRPRVVLVENTPGILSRGIDRVLGDLAASGYDAEWSVLSACALGAPHTRERVFIVAYPGGERRETGKQASIQARRVQLELRPWGRPSSRVCRASDGIPDRMDRIGALGNAVVPQVAEWLGKRILEAQVSL